MSKDVEFGLDTFGDVTLAPDGKFLPQAQVIRNVIAEAELADRLGIDFFGIGEHHRTDFAISAPEVALAAIAARTRRIRLGSAVTVLSSDDPIRIFERFSTLDAISQGRAEVILGRGSFIESFPLFGFDLGQYEELFEQKLDLYSAITSNRIVDWQGNWRPPLKGQEIFPPIEKGSLKTWIGVGGTPESVTRAVRYDMHLMLAIIGGDPQRFRPYVDLYQKLVAESGRVAREVGVHSPGYVAETDEKARRELFPHFKKIRDRLGQERGWPPVTEVDFEREIEHGSLYAGSPGTVARKIAETVKGLGLSRFQMKYSAGPMMHENLLSSIELYANKVIPQVRNLLA
ncbi:MULTISPECIES: LLM class flavin-dependent oxidoreductase [Rhizobium]|uniref:Oxidoreductase, LLM family n=1 Tax=Rhizobium favelukesii TaxID=348824 RepID=W6RV72_9HYPH|nr:MULTISPECIES: LLM class flavin-dependent oxidoreductase [Rhizobium]MCA0805611.1 LLM class flavin-dependent oxidoreductase [Rhizobium sp. T1473]MCS0459228.1 LLM class flavin-dependent oxidoreductase [Rhizobium favelukesii]UFS79049.1 LLM class flavin-dependent oxidoreductase [Rhizobium sp. T136]CDM62543.1 putative oxidoreductase, LLM family [Rhizobium favelukesii]